MLSKMERHPFCFRNNRGDYDSGWRLLWSSKDSPATGRVPSTLFVGSPKGEKLSGGEGEPHESQSLSRLDKVNGKFQLE